LAQVPPGVFEPVIEGKIIARLGVLLGLCVRLPANHGLKGYLLLIKAEKYKGAVVAGRHSGVRQQLPSYLASFNEPKSEHLSTFISP
jgi:hypothetical protein